MKVHHIDLSTLQPSGAISMDLADERAFITVVNALPPTDTSAESPCHCP